MGAGMYVRLFWLVIAVYVLLRGALYYAQYHGSPSETLRRRVEGSFSPEDIRRGFEYARRGLGARVGLAALDLAALLAILQMGLGWWIAERTRSWSGGIWPLQAVLFTGILVLGLALLRLPFDYYLGHVLERRFGFSTQSAGSWLWVQLKHLGVILVMSLLAALLFYSLLRALPRAWVLAIPAAFTLFQAVVALLVPSLLVPLFYHPSPLPEGPLRTRVLEVIGKAGITVKDALVIDESRYSRHTNAFFAGLGPTRNIFLYDTLLEEHGEDEALTVVAHEAGHWRESHVAKGVALGGLGLLLACLLLSWFYSRLAGPGGSGWPPLSDPASLPAVLLLALLGSFFASPIESAVSRRFEREADRAALELTGNRDAFVEAEKRLARTNRAQLLPHPLVVFWYYSHPPAIERIESASQP